MLRKLEVWQVVGPCTHIELNQLIPIHSCRDVTHNSTLIHKYYYSYASFPVNVLHYDGSKNSYCVYIIDLKCDSMPNEIVKVDLKWNEIQKRWSTDDECGTLSVTCEGNVILAVNKKMKLNEYTSDGQLIHVIQLTIMPCHAIKLVSGHCLVSFGNENHWHSRNGISIVDEDGGELKSAGEENANFLLGRPEYIAVDSRGSIMVSNCFGEVQLFSSNLKYKKHLTAYVYSCRYYAKKIHLDESDDPRLYMVDDKLMSSIRILNFGKQRMTKSTHLLFSLSMIYLLYFSTYKCCYLNCSNSNR